MTPKTKIDVEELQKANSYMRRYFAHNDDCDCQACLSISAAEAHLRTLSEPPASTGELKPCLKCGSTDISIDKLGAPLFMFQVFCGNCQTKKFTTEQEAIQAWNTRTLSEPPITAHNKETRQAQKKVWTPAELQEIIYHYTGFTISLELSLKNLCDAINNPLPEKEEK